MLWSTQSNAIYISARSQIDEAGSDGSMPLHHAVQFNLRETVKVLIEDGADVDVNDDAGEYPIHFILRAIHDGKCTTKEDFKEMVTLLKESIDRQDALQATLLHSLLTFQKTSFAKILVEDFNASHRIEDYALKYPVHCLCKPGFSEREKEETDIVKLIVDRDILGKRDKEKYTPLHYAAQRCDSELIIALLKAGASATEPWKGGRTCIHLAVLGTASQKDFTDAITSFLECSIRKMDFIELLNTDDDDEKTPLYTALEHRLFARAEALLDFGANPIAGKHQLLHLAVETDGTNAEFKSFLRKIQMTQSVKKGSDDFKTIVNRYENQRTALHLAMEKRKFPRVEILLNFNADPGIVTPESRKNLIHLATTYEGRDENFKNILLRTQTSLSSDGKFREVVNAADGNDKTPLHLAIEHGYFSRVEMLLESGADPSLEERSGKNSLHLAFEYNAPGRTVRRLLQRSCEIEVHEDHDMKTPIQYLTDKTHLSAIRVLQKVHDVNSEEDHPLDLAIMHGRWDIVEVLLVKGAELHHATLKKAIQDEEANLTLKLVRHTKKKNLRKVLNKIFPLREGQDSRDGNYTHTTLFRELLYRMPNVAKEALERCVKVKKNEGFVKFDYRYIHPHNELPPHDSERATLMGGGDSDCINARLCDPLQIMVRKELTSLLQHAVVRSYIYSKWKRFGAKFYTVNLVLYIFFIIFLTLYAMTINHPLSETCRQAVRDSECGSLTYLLVAYMSSACVLLLVIYHITKEIFWLCLSVRTYFFDYQNYVEWLLYTTTTIFVLPVYINDCGCPAGWQWQVGIFCVFLGWINLMFIASNIPRISLYALMFREILMTLLNLMLFAALLITAFSFILFMMFHDPTSTAKISSFSNISISFLSTMNMIVGGVGFETIFGVNVPPSDYVPIPYHIFNFFMWMVFLLLFPIIFRNLLISLAVGDVMTVRNKAELRKVKLQVEVFSNVRLLLSCRAVNYVIRSSYIEPMAVFPLDTKRKSWIRMYIGNVLWGEEIFLKSVEDNSYAQKRKKERKKLATKEQDMN